MEIINIAQLDKSLSLVRNYWFECVKDKKAPLSYRELITRYTDYRLPDLYAGLYYIIDKEGNCYESFEEIELGQGSKFYL